MLIFAFLLGCFTITVAVGYLVFKYLEFSSIVHKKAKFKYKPVNILNNSILLH